MDHHKYITTAIVVRGLGDESKKTWRSTILYSRQDKTITANKTLANNLVLEYSKSTPEQIKWSIQNQKDFLSSLISTVKEIRINISNTRMFIHYVDNVCLFSLEKVNIKNREKAINEVTEQILLKMSIYLRLFYMQKSLPNSILINLNFIV